MDHKDEKSGLELTRQQSDYQRAVKECFMRDPRGGGASENDLTADEKERDEWERNEKYKQWLATQTALIAQDPTGGSMAREKEFNRKLRDATDRFATNQGARKFTDEKVECDGILAKNWDGSSFLNQANDEFAAKAREQAQLERDKRYREHLLNHPRRGRCDWETECDSIPTLIPTSNEKPEPTKPDITYTRQDTNRGKKTALGETLTRMDERIASAGGVWSTKLDTLAAEMAGIARKFPGLFAGAPPPAYTDAQLKLELEHKQSKKAAVHTVRCANTPCKNPALDAKRTCIVCKIVSYCSRDCQKKHHRIHKANCMKK